jgi:hypothetical protein
MLGIAVSPFVVVLLVAIGAVAAVCCVYINGAPARLLARAELERARARLPSRLQARLSIEMKMRETPGAWSAGAIRGRLGR